MDDFTSNMNVDKIDSNINRASTNSDEMDNKVVNIGKSQAQSNNKRTTKPPKAKAPKINPNSSGDTTSCNKRRKSSAVWLHFDEVLDMEDGNGDEKEYAKCKYCNAMIGSSSKNGTTCLHNHLLRCKKLPANMDKSQKMLDLNTKTFVGISGMNETVVVPSLWHFNQEVVRKSLARMLIVDELLFAFVEREGFRNFCKTINPAFRVPSRPTITRDCYSFFIEERKKMKDMLINLSSRVSLTTDAWTSAQNLNYMCLTAHFIDADFVLHKRIINFCPLAGHSGILIGRGVEKCLADWGIKRVMAVTVDNASSNDVAVDYLRKRLNHWESSILDGKYLHIRCVAHILNLVVKDGLKDMDLSILKIRGLVRYVRSSPARLLKFKTCIEEEGLSRNGVTGMVCLDVETRWNSTFLMLESALKFRKAFDNLLMKDSACVRELKKLGDLPNDEDWKKISSFLPILSIFYDATLTLSGSRYVTCNDYVHDAFAIGLVISEACINGQDESHRRMAHQMKLKYDKYWGDVSNINYFLFVALLLDPRRKMGYVNWLVKRNYDDTKAKILSLNLKLFIHELFDVYASSTTTPVVSQQSTSSSSSSTMDLYCSPSVQGKVRSFSSHLTSQFQLETGAGDKNINKTEMEKYLEDPVERDTPCFMILHWWKNNQEKYPIISRIARDVLAIPVSTVASESAFSTGGRVLDSFRTSLTPKMVESLICTQDWERGNNTPITIDEHLATLEELIENRV